MTATRPEYLPQLDGLRAFAVFAVMVHHFLLVGRVPEDFVTLGSMGVRLFFVLSGFLITGILLRCRQRASTGEATPGQQLRRFYIRRFLRIFPVYYVALAAVALLDLPTVRASFFWHVTYLSNFFFSFLGRFDGPLSHLWSLAVEEQFYVLWPWLIVFAPRRYLHGIILMTIISGPSFRFLMSAFGGSEVAPFILLPGCMDSLGLGGLLAFYNWEKRPRHPRQSLLVLSAGAVVFLISLALYMTGRGAPVVSAGASLAMSLIFVWIVDRASIGFTGIPGSVLEAKPIVYLGRISYGIYVFHNFMPVLVPRVLAATGVPNPTGRTGIIVNFVLFSAATVLTAAVSWTLLEGPLNSLKKHFPYRLRRPDLSASYAT